MFLEVLKDFVGGPSAKGISVDRKLAKRDAPSALFDSNFRGDRVDHEKATVVWSMFASLA